MITPTDIFTRLRNLKLTPEERSAMRSVLAALSAESYATTPLPSPYFAFFMRPAPLFAVALVLLVLVGGSTSALARGALPGDALYAVKVHVNENVERALAPTLAAKAGVDVKQAEERLAEIELLAATGDADTADIAAATESMRAKVAAATSTAELLDDGGDAAAADDIRANISSSLLAHADILNAQAENLGDGERESLRALSVATAVTADDAQDEGTTTDDVTAQIALDREDGARQSINALTKAIAQAGTDVPQETHDELLLALANIESDFEAEQSAPDDTALRAETYQALERRAYRALTALTTAGRIADATGKEVIVTIDSNDTTDETATDTAATAPVLMKAALTASPTIATSTPEKTHRHERPLQFLIRDAR